ncbi:MAG TPA: ABC transporter permease [Gemmatimonadaceae bacterium]
MSILGRARHWLRAIASRSRLEREMREEMEAHLTQATARFMARGMPEAEARDAARREFGHLGSMEQSGREARGAHWITGIGEDLRHAMRYFARTPLAAVTIVLTLALGIGFSSAGFTVIQGMLVRPAPGVPDDAALVKIRGRQNVKPYARRLSWDELSAYASQTNTFAAVAGWTERGVVISTGDESDVFTARGVFVTANFFRTIRTSLAAGRYFEQSRFEEVAPPELTAVVSHSLARQLDGVDATRAVGKVLTVNGVPVTIIGVTQPRFNGPMPSREQRTLWLPLSAREILTGDRQALDDPDVAAFEALGRLQAGVDVEEALPAVRLVASRANANARTPEDPGLRRIVSPDPTGPANLLLSADVVRLRGMMQVVGPYQSELVPGIVVFSAIAVLILLVCTTTVNSLLLGTAVTRRYEIGVRLALGASRWRVVRQLLTEVAVLAVAGGVLGMYVFGTMVQVVEVARDGFDVTPDRRTMVFTLLFALLTAILCGLSPALHATRTALAEVLKDSAVNTTSRSRLQRAFVVAQIAIAQPLMVSLGAALAFLARDLQGSSHAELRERLIVANIDTYSGTNATRPDPIPRLIERIGAIGGVVSVVPRVGSGGLSLRPVTSPSSGTDSAITIQTEHWYAAPGFFDAVDAPVILGRDFAAADSALEIPPLILSEPLARQLFPSGAVGQRVRAVIWPQQREVETEIIGVARAGYGGGFLQFESDLPLSFSPLRRDREGTLMIRTAGPAEPLLQAIRETVRREAPTFPLTRLSTLAAGDEVRREELRKIGSAGLGSGAIALSLASVGLYAMLSVAVGQRRREIGVRIAIGAHRSQVVRLFFLSGLRTAALGVLIGLPFNLVALKLIAGELPMPAAQLAIVAPVIMSVVLLVAAFASWLPARRAAAVDPSLVLRSE